MHHTSSERNPVYLSDGGSAFVRNARRILGVVLTSPLRARAFLGVVVTGGLRDFHAGVGHALFGRANDEILEGRPRSQAQT